MKSFSDILSEEVESTGSRLCVGLDIDREQLAFSGSTGLRDLASFGRMVVDATLDYAVAYKLNLAFFERYGTDGFRWMEEVLAHIGGRRLTVADAKRGDIASSARHYAASLFERFGFDAVTVNPYMGRDAIEPFLGDPGKGVFVICLTSNEGATDLQLQRVGSDPLYGKVIDLVKSLNGRRNCGLVVGSTWSKELPSIRRRAGDMPLLIPGIGPQGGDLVTGVREGNRGGIGLIAVSRAILFVGDRSERAIRQAARRLCRDIRVILDEETLPPAGETPSGMD